MGQNTARPCLCLDCVRSPHARSKTTHSPYNNRLQLPTLQNGTTVQYGAVWWRAQVCQRGLASASSARLCKMLLCTSRVLRLSGDAARVEHGFNPNQCRRKPGGPATHVGRHLTPTSPSHRRHCQQPWCPQNTLRPSKTAEHGPAARSSTEATQQPPYTSSGWHRRRRLPGRLWEHDPRQACNSCTWLTAHSRPGCASRCSSHQLLHSCMPTQPRCQATSSCC